MRAKKPKILSQKIKLAELIKKHCTKRDYHRHERGYYWRGYFNISGGREVYIYFQMYVRRPGVDFVVIRWNDSSKALTITEIKDLIRNIDNEQVDIEEDE